MLLWNHIFISFKFYIPQIFKLREKNSANVILHTEKKVKIQEKKTNKLSLPVSSKITSLAINLSKSSIMVKVGMLKLIVGSSVVGVELLLLLRDGKAMYIISLFQCRLDPQRLYFYVYTHTFLLVLLINIQLKVVCRSFFPLILSFEMLT